MVILSHAGIDDIHKFYFSVSIGSAAVELIFDVFVQDDQLDFQIQEHIIESGLKKLGFCIPNVYALCFQLQQS